MANKNHLSNFHPENELLISRRAALAILSAPLVALGLNLSPTFAPELRAQSSEPEPSDSFPPADTTVSLADPQNQNLTAGEVDPSLTDTTTQAPAAAVYDPTNPATWPEEIAFKQVAEVVNMARPVYETWGTTPMQILNHTKSIPGQPYVSISISPDQLDPNNPNSAYNIGVHQLKQLNRPPMVTHLIDNSDPVLTALSSNFIFISQLGPPGNNIDFYTRAVDPRVSIKQSLDDVFILFNINNLANPDITNRIRANYLPQLNLNINAQFLNVRSNQPIVRIKVIYADGRTDLI